MTNKNIAAALQFREAVIVGLENPTYEDERQTLEDLRVQVCLLDEHYARVSCRIPTCATDIDLRTYKRDRCHIHQTMGARS